MPPIENQSRTHYLPYINESGQEWQGEFKVPSNPKKKVTFNTTKQLRAFRETRLTRGAPFPNTILDRKALTKALDELNIVVTNRHIDDFYQHLHRQNYPELDSFVEEYKKIFADHPSDLSISSDDNATSPGSVGSRYRRRRLPIALIDFLSDNSKAFVTITSNVVSIEKSPSGNTTKVGLILHDGLCVETHIMRYREHDAYHASVSVSSQVSSEAGCSFDPVSTLGLGGNLTSGEILEQVVHARRIFGEDNQEELHHRHVVQNVTFMGLGEPLHNYNHVVDACQMLANKRVWDLCHGRITISTIGVTPRIYDLTRDLPGVILAVGLHAPNQSLRRKIVPSARKYPLDALMNALDNHNMQNPHGQGLVSPTGCKRRMVMIEYIMIKGKTSSMECAHELGQLCKNRDLVVNLIPFIHKYAKDRRKCPSPAHIKEFQSIVASYGALCNVRLNMSVKLCRDIAQKMDPETRQSVQDIALVDMNENSMKHPEEKRRVASGVPREIVASASSSSLMKPHANLDSTIGNEATEDKRCIGAGVPCEIVASACSSSPSTHQKKSDSTVENEPTLQFLFSKALHPETDSEVPHAIVATASRLCAQIPQPICDSTFKNDSTLKTLHCLRRHLALPTIISAAVIFRILIYERPR